LRRHGEAVSATGIYRQRIGEMPKEMRQGENHSAPRRRRTPLSVPLLAGVRNLPPSRNTPGRTPGTIGRR